jgi:hypothetical protein
MARTVQYTCDFTGKAKKHEAHFALHIVMEGDKASVAASDADYCQTHLGSAVGDAFRRGAKEIKIIKVVEMVQYQCKYCDHPAHSTASGLRLHIEKTHPTAI